MKNKNKFIKIFLGTFLLLLANIIFISMAWMNKQFADISLGEIIFHMKVPLAGTNTKAFSNLIKYCLIIAPLLTLLGLIPVIKCDSEHIFILNIGHMSFSIPFNIWKILYPQFTTFILFIALMYSTVILDIPEFVISKLNKSTLYEDYYVDPRMTEITFPDKKRNLIYIFMESMENSYMSINEGGIQKQNLIPEMTDLLKSSIGFSASGMINGASVPANTNWTMSALVAQTAGIPLTIPINGNEMSEFSSFLPGAHSIGDILKEQGYQQVFLLGSDAKFGGRLNYMEQHGDYNIEDYYYAISEHWIDNNYHVFWGYEDQKLYSNAKKELLRLSEDSEPFNLTMLTVDTHFIGGYVCDLCRQDILDDKSNVDQYSNVIACASRQISEFVSWIQKQSFYENTTIVIVGDHCTMDTEYMKDTPTGYQRKVFATVVNSAIDYNLDYDRLYTTLDIFPTTLASLGAKINGNRLGLGTNLFSDTPTLIEEMGIDNLDAQIKLNSDYYNQNILYR